MSLEDQEPAAQAVKCVRSQSLITEKANVKVMAHPLAGANVDRGVRVEIRWKHRKQRG